MVFKSAEAPRAYAAQLISSRVISGKMSTPACCCRAHFLNFRTLFRRVLDGITCGTVLTSQISYIDFVDGVKPISSYSNVGMSTKDEIGLVDIVQLILTGKVAPQQLPLF